MAFKDIVRKGELVDDLFYLFIDESYNLRYTCILTLYQLPLCFDDTKKSFENMVGKRENAGNQHFLLFQQSFLSYPSFY